MRAVVGQQISVAAATTVVGRIVAAHGRDGAFPEPDDLVDAPLEALGMIGRRAETIRTLARRVVAGDLVLDGSVDHDDLVASLVALPGIGPWTASYVALRSGEPDAFPAGDLHLRRVLGAASERDAVARAEAWRPWRAYAAMHLWQTPCHHEGDPPMTDDHHARPTSTPPSGPVRIAVLDDGVVVACCFADHWDGAVDRVRARYPDAVWADGDTAPAQAAAATYVAGDVGALDELEVDTGGTDFQRRVWAALRTIPAGETWSYADLAAAVGLGRRDAGRRQANGANPVSLVVPCHRVIRSRRDPRGLRRRPRPQGVAPRPRGRLGWSERPQRLPDPPHVTGPICGHRSGTDRKVLDRLVNVRRLSACT